MLVTGSFESIQATVVYNVRILNSYNVISVMIVVGSIIGLGAGEDYANTYIFLN